MSPIALGNINSPIDNLAALKAQVAQTHAAVLAKKPVADDYMYKFKHNAPLPLLGPDHVDIDDSAFHVQVESLVAALSSALRNKDAESFASLFLPNGKSLRVSKLKSRCLA